nr:zinc-binding dehydrogenase [Pseudomonas mediterranea]
MDADEVVDYRKQAFEQVLSGYDMVSAQLEETRLKSPLAFSSQAEKIVSLVGPLNRAFAKARRMNILLSFVFGLMSRQIIARTKKNNVTYSFLFTRPDGVQLSEIGMLVKSECIKPVIDRVFAFE